MNYFALASLSVATIISLFLPSVPKSIYFHRNNENLGHEKQSGPTAAKACKILIWDRFIHQIEFQCYQFAAALKKQKSMEKSQL